MIKIISFIILNLIYLDVFAQDEIPPIGTIKTIQTKACRIDVVENRKTRINYTYTTDPGWHILSYKPVVISKNSTASYSLKHTPSRFTYTSTSAIYSKFIQLMELAAEKNVFEKYEGRINQIRSDFEKYSNNKVAAYSRIAVAGLVAGSNKSSMKRPGKLYLDLKITMIYMPETEETFLESLDHLRQIIDSEGYNNIGSNL
ncbi:MAG: hypothetical protein JWR18_3551 [Segetibacter sp.]|nr:hypothetical protein [Segetibacter sp.]